jgi:5-methylcytosine-specific restriction endonuclease McrA
MGLIVDEPALVLNRNWQPVTFLPIKVCIATVMRDMASIMCPTSYYLMDLEEWMEKEPKENDRLIKTAGRPLIAPETVVLKKYGERPPRKISFNRPNLFRRDQYECQYCGAELPCRKLTIDHVVPRAQNGGTSWENCVAACSRCNAHKADRTPMDARMKLRKTPRKPTWKPGIRTPELIFPSWVPFLEKEGAA